MNVVPSEREARTPRPSPEGEGRIAGGDPEESTCVVDPSSTRLEWLADLPLSGAGEKLLTAAVLSFTPAAFAFASSAAIKNWFSTICAKGSPGSTSPPNVRNTGRTTSSTRLSVTIMSRIGCAPSATFSQTPSVSNNLRAAATIAEARSSPSWLPPSIGSATVTETDGPRPCRNAIASVRPAKPPPAIRTSTWSSALFIIAGSWATRLYSWLQHSCLELLV